jgi:hypothetical protein
VRTQGDTSVIDRYPLGHEERPGGRRPVTISRGTCSPFASPVRRRPAGPFILTEAVGSVREDPRLLFCLPTRLDGAGGGRARLRTGAGTDFDPLREFGPLSSLN